MKEGKNGRKRKKKGKTTASIFLKRGIFWTFHRTSGGNFMNLASKSGISLNCPLFLSLLFFLPFSLQFKESCFEMFVSILDNLPFLPLLHFPVIQNPKFKSHSVKNALSTIQSSPLILGDCEMFLLE